MLLIVLLVLLPVGARAHFQMLIPSTDVVGTKDAKSVAIDLLFTHPMEGHLMNMAKPIAFGVAIKGGVTTDLLTSLKEETIEGNSTWETSHQIRQPGDHVFYVEPQPYWEPEEDKFIIHYTKVVVNALGMEEGWDKELGLKTEILPLVRPYGLWTGNLFRGIVKLDGKPIPYAEIEVEYYNEPGERSVEAPTDAHITQVIKADANGVFSYAMPRAGWWGFAALSDADYTIKGTDGKEHGVELGALIWIRVLDMK